MQNGHPVLYVVACGGRPAGAISEAIPELRKQGWESCVIATPSALKFLDTEELKRLTGHVVRYDYKQPDEPDILPQADAFVVIPATFNSINKMAAGISDTLALGMLNEALGRGTPVLAVPTPNTALANHPAFKRSISDLRAWGADLMFDPVEFPLPTPNMGPPAADLFPWRALMTRLSKLHETLQAS